MKKNLNIVFAGTPDFAATALQALIHSEHVIKAVYTQPDRPAGRGRKLTASPVKQLALDNHLPVFQPVTLRDIDEQISFAKLEADVMVVVAYGLILPLPILTAPKLGCLNIHASLLPSWRGAAPIQRAILAGDVKTGVTIMQMDQGLDTGDMLYTVECPITSQDTSQTLHDQLAQLGAEAILTTLQRMLENNLQPEKQDAAQASYAHKISKDEAEIDWQLSAKQLDQKIRAFNPWPVVQTKIKGEVLRVWQASVLSKTSSVEPGIILQASPVGIEIATGEGVLLLEKMQLPGGKILTAAEILNARRNDFVIGSQLGT